MKDRNRGCGLPLLLMLLLSVLLVWAPILGGLLAGFVGGRAARRVGLALLAGLVAAGIVGGGLWWASFTEFKVGGSQVVAGPLFFLGIANAAGVLAGALIGSSAKAAKAVGVLVLAAGTAWFVPHALDVWRLANQLRPEPGEARPIAGDCAENLRKLYSATLMYAADWDDTLPPAETWMTTLSDPVQPRAQEPWLHCPAVASAGSAEYGYAMDDRMGAAALAQIADRSAAPLFYDSSSLQKDAHDAFSSLPETARHPAGNYVLNADGSLVERAAP